MYDSDVAAHASKGMEMISPRIEGEKKVMKAKDLEKYFGALKDSELLDEMKELILRMRSSELDQPS